MEKFWGTKSWRKILERLKQKIDIFIETKNIFNPKNNIKLVFSRFRIKGKLFHSFVIMNHRLIYL